MALCDDRRKDAATVTPAALPDRSAVEPAPFAFAIKRGLVRGRPLSNWQKTVVGSLYAMSAIIICVALCASRQR